MKGNEANETFDKHVRLHIYNHFVEKGKAPTMVETAEALSISLTNVQAVYQRLAEGRALVLQGNSEILMAEPFSAVPTSFQVEVGNRMWWGNCIWDTLGIPAMLHEDARVITSCGCCNDSIVLEIKDGLLEEAFGIVHFAIPPQDWWKNVVFA
jgi:hypothetical protein